jgi:hypothetical protein
MRKIYIFLFLSGFVVQAQVKPATQDTVKTGFSVESTAKNPKSISPPTRMIPFQIDTSISTLDGFSVNYPIILTQKNMKSWF